jgi:hypothetical protein
MLIIFKIVLTKYASLVILSTEGQTGPENPISEGGNMDTRIIVDGEGLTEVEVIVVPHGSTGREIVLELAKKTGIEVEQAILFIEDGDEPLNLDLVITEEAARDVHHVHRARRIKVLVYYQNDAKEKAFPPSTRVQVVLDWAVGPEGFKIDPTIAPEMELALHGETTELRKQAHIGRYVRHPHHELALDLIRGIVPNGSQPW